MMLLTTIDLTGSNLYNLKINDIDGKKIDLNNFRGKYIIFVNVASKCGFTKQYSDLEILHQKYKNDLVVIGLPCNQFGGQEPASEAEIKSFCSKNFGVSFVLTEKINTKGKDIHPIYSWLTNKKNNGKKDSSVKWNFQKYLVNREGELIDYFNSLTSPLSSKITNLIK